MSTTTTTTTTTTTSSDAETAKKKTLPRHVQVQTQYDPTDYESLSRKQALHIKYVENELALARKERHDALVACERLQQKYDKLLQTTAERCDGYLDQIHEIQSYMLLSGTRDSAYSGSTTRSPMDLNRALVLEMSSEIQLLNHKVRPLRYTCVQVMDRYAKEVSNTERMQRDLMRKMESASVDFNKELRNSAGQLNALKQWIESKNITLPSFVQAADGDVSSSTSAEKRVVGSKSKPGSTLRREEIVVHPSSDYEDN